MSEYEESVKQAFSLVLSDSADQSIELCQALEASHHDRAEHLFVLALTAMFLGDLPKTIQLLSKGHERAPNDQQFCDALSVLNARVGNLSDSIYFAKLGIVSESNPLLDTMMPNEFRRVEEQLSNVGIAQYGVEGWVSFHERRYEDAVKQARKQIALDGGDSETFLLLGRSHGELGNYSEAIDAAMKSAEKDPDNEEVRIFLGDLLEATGSIPEALEVYRAIIRRNPGSLVARNQLVSALIQAETEDLEAVRLAVSGLSSTIKQQAPAVPNNSRRKLPAVPGRIRVAYLINEQAVSQFSGVLGTALADRTEAEFRTSVYQQYSQPYVGTDRLRRSADDWRPTYNIDDETFAHIIANDEVHVLVDMCGLGAGNRQHLLARGVAPVQVNWLGLPFIGCPETTDAVIEDDVAYSDFDVDGVERHRMQGSMFAYAGGTIQIELTRDNPSPVAAIGHVTFGGLMEPATLGQMVEPWVEILRAVPDSRLVLGGIAGIDAETQSQVASLFGGHGMANRVSVQVSRSAATARAEMFAAIDILLDTPRAAHVDLVCDALWQGVPVVTMRHAYPSGRLGASALIAAGMDGWVADTPEGYIGLAAQLASDQKAISELRRSLRETIKDSALCDTKGFMLRLETAFRALCERAVDAG